MQIFMHLAAGYQYITQTDDKQSIINALQELSIFVYYHVVGLAVGLAVGYCSHHSYWKNSHLGVFAMFYEVCDFGLLAAM